jgi:hypothetical protein
MLTFVRAPEEGEETLVRTGPTREAIVSWNTLALTGALELRVNAHDGRTSAWLPYAAFSADRRASLEGADTFVRIDTDVVRATVDFVGLGIRSQGPLDALFVSTPDYGAPSSIVALPALALDVPPYSQYEPAYPAERGWCAPASLAMLLAYRSYPIDVPIVAREVFDARYGGTGNWSLNVAFAASLGFRAAVVHLRDIAHAHAFLADDIPLALSIAWTEGDLPGAPLPASPGHLVVLRGIDANGDALVNDPAQPEISVTYPREAFERAWLGHGGIAWAIVPAPLVDTLLRLANE